jgi:membrane-associated phospholipid phosphatase
MSKTNTQDEELSWLERLDIAAVESLKPMVGGNVSRAVDAIGKVADEPPLLALSAALLVAGRLGGSRRLERAGERMLLAHLCAIAGKDFAKNRVDRSRPREMMKTGDYQMGPGESDESAMSSFPSGHTAGAVAVARAYTREFPEHAGLAYLAAGLLGALQIPRLAHFPTDILAGAAVGLAAEAAVHGVWEAAEE